MGAHMDYTDILTSIENLSLEKLGDILSDNDIKLLKEYRLDTLGTLLGATKGFTFNEIVESMEQGVEKLNQLTDLIPSILISKYREFNEKHPLGDLGRYPDETK